MAPHGCVSGSQGRVGLKFWYCFPLKLEMFRFRHNSSVGDSIHTREDILRWWYTMCHEQCHDMDIGMEEEPGVFITGSRIKKVGVQLERWCRNWQKKKGETAVKFKEYMNRGNVLPIHTTAVRRKKLAFNWGNSRIPQSGPFMMACFPKHPQVHTSPPKEQVNLKGNLCRNQVLGLMASYCSENCSFKGAIIHFK